MYTPCCRKDACQVFVYTWSSTAGSSLLHSGFPGERSLLFLTECTDLDHGACSQDPCVGSFCHGTGPSGDIHFYLG